MASGDCCLITVVVEKCRGMLMSGLSKIQQQQHHLPLTSKGRHYLEELLLKLVACLVANQPKTVQDAKEQVSRKFPEPLSKWALEEAESAQEKGKKKVAFPVDKLHHALKEHNPGMEKQVTLIFSGVLEYMASDILKLTTNYAKNISSHEINDQDIKIAMFADNVLMDVFHSDEMEEDLVIVSDFAKIDEGEKKVSYESIVRDFMSDEASYLRDLNLIIKLIKKEFEAAPKLFSDKDIDSIFSNIGDLAELSEKLIGLLEEAVEMTDETCPVPLVGSCFEDLALECCFDWYSDYTITLMSDTWQPTFNGILMETAVTSHLQNVCSGFRDVVTYVLPNLLLAPIYHCFYYLEQIELLEKNSPDPEDKQCFSQALSAITPIKPVLEAKTQTLPKLRPSEASLRKSWKGGPSTIRMTDIEKSIDGWWGRTITQSCNEFLHEGSLQRVGNKRMSDRHVFLFDSLLISCKSNHARLPTVTISQYEYRLKERILIRKATVRDIIDIPDGPNGPKYQFEIKDGEKHELHIFQAKTKAEKRAWMAHLIRLQYRSTFDRMLDQIVREEAAKQVLRLPTPDKYRFAVPDSNENLILEETDSVNESQSQVDVIKGGTVLKLVERLTYHRYSDPSYTKTFLTTFRSFCKPKELLELLIERYRIPEPPPTAEQQMAIDRGELPNREDLKRFREEYRKPIQLRVMNVIRQWLEHHWYDFDRDPELLANAEIFVASVRGKNMKKWARTMQKIIKRKKDLEEPEPEKVQPSEMVGTVWTKADKETNSPNLLQMMHFSTKITRWVSKEITQVQNLEERLVVMNRAIEVMQVLKQLNNFNGLLEFVAAFSSSSVHRLNFTKEALSDRSSKALEECMDMCSGRLTKMLQRLQSIDPPCVPFVGSFLTNILKTEEGNPHLLPNQPEHFHLINFSKRRKVSEIMLQLLQYQNQHYNLTLVPSIRDFFFELDPLGDRNEKEFNDHLFNTSLKIEPREVERPPKLPKIFTDKEIKSPGIVPGKRHTSRTITKDEIRQFEKHPVTRHGSLRSDSHLKKRLSLYDVSMQKRPSLDTMSVKSFAGFYPENTRTPSPKDEPPPPRPRREPKTVITHGMSDLVSAPPMMFQHSRFLFDLSSTRLQNVSPHHPARHSPMPSTPATAPPWTYVSNGTPTLDSSQVSPLPTQLDHKDDSTPPPIPPRDRANGSYSDRLPLYTKSVDRVSPPSTPPPIPPRDPPSVPPRAPVRQGLPLLRNYDFHPTTPHVNGGRYVPDPTLEPSPAAIVHMGRGSIPGVYLSDGPFPSAPPYSERGAVFDFSEDHPVGTPPRTYWDQTNFPSHNDMNPSRLNPTSNDVPPPVPRRQPSSTDAAPKTH